jgi:hypothetical protein
MAKNDNGNDKDMKTGRPPRDEQMKAVQKAHGTPTRQSELPPFVSKDAMPGETD